MSDFNDQYSGHLSPATNARRAYDGWAQRRHNMLTPMTNYTNPSRGIPQVAPHTTQQAIDYDDITYHVDQNDIGYDILHNVTSWENGNSVVGTDDFPYHPPLCDHTNNVRSTPQQHEYSHTYPVRNYNSNPSPLHSHHTRHASGHRIHNMNHGVNLQRSSSSGRPRESSRLVDSRHTAHVNSPVHRHFHNIHERELYDPEDPGMCDLQHDATRDGFFDTRSWHESTQRTPWNYSHSFT
jgi:hypothetical protein